MAKVWAYVDCFNLYYGLLRFAPRRRDSDARVPTKHKWLDIPALCQGLVPNDTVERVKCFLARVQPDPWDADKHVRQETYIRALQARPSVEIVFGRFKAEPGRRIYESCFKAGHKHVVWVMLPEEKGSDVNLAAHLVFDGTQGRYDQALVVSNDSDLVEPIRIVRQVIGKDVVLGCSAKGLWKKAGRKGRWIQRPQKELKDTATTVRKISESLLSGSQLPNPVRDVKGKEIRKPKAWT